MGRGFPRAYKAAGAYRTLGLLARLPPDLWPPPRHPKPSLRRWPLPPPGARRAGHPRTGALSLFRGPAASAARCRRRVAAETRSPPARGTNENSAAATGAPGAVAAADLRLR